MTIDDLMKAWVWRPIPGCPGRYVLREISPYLSLEALLGPEAQASEFRVESAKDIVLVVSLDGGGIISYKRDDGSFLHTLNTEEGFERKLKQLGIDVRGKDEIESGK
jgi:hypothetical protein